MVREGRGRNEEDRKEITYEKVLSDEIFKERILVSINTKQIWRFWKLSEWKGDFGKEKKKKAKAKEWRYKTSNKSSRLNPG